MKDEGEAESASVISSQGIQVGPGGVQYNTWAVKQPLDPASLGALNPHTAVARLQQLSHDDIVDLFAKAASGDVTEVLGALLTTDEALAVAILADISPRKAKELTGPLVEVWPWLDSLPNAAVEIDRRATALKWVPAPPVARLAHVDRHRDPGLHHTRDEGFTRTYEQGRIYWSVGFARIRSVVTLANIICILVMDF